VATPTTQIRRARGDHIELSISRCTRIQKLRVLSEAPTYLAVFLVPELPTSVLIGRRFLQPYASCPRSRRVTEPLDCWAEFFRSVGLLPELSREANSQGKASLNLSFERAKCIQAVSGSVTNAETLSPPQDLLTAHPRLLLSRLRIESHRFVHLGNVPLKSILPG